MSSQSHSIKQQFERILKDTKILCELEPFVKKWSLEETLRNICEDTTTPLHNKEDVQYNAISSILQTKQDILPNSSDNNQRENMFRKIKESLEIITPTKSNNVDHNNSLVPFHQSYNSFDENQVGIQHQDYDHELEKTRKMLDEIEKFDAVQPLDIEEYKRGLGGKPDGPDLHKTTIREWKNIFMEHWLFLNQSGKCQRKMIAKRFLENDLSHNRMSKSTVHPNPISLLKINADANIESFGSGINLDSHFITKKGCKNISTGRNGTVHTLPIMQQQSFQSHSTYLPTLVHQNQREPDKTQGKRNSMLHLQKIEKERKIANSANKRTSIVPSEYEKILAKCSKPEGITITPTVNALPSTRKINHVNKNNNASRPLRSSTSLKANIEIRRLREKVRLPTRPFTSATVSNI